MWFLQNFLTVCFDCLEIFFDYLVSKMYSVIFLYLKYQNKHLLGEKVK
jgi:hypothetical protein